MEIIKGVLVRTDDNDIINGVLTIPEGVTIVAGLNGWRENLKKIIFPESLKTIGDRAFAGCCDLATIVLPRVVTIGEQAFFDCNNLTALVLPSGITSIGELAFYGCRNLKTLNLPPGIKSIGNYAFWECVNIETLTLPPGITALGDAAFWSCQLTTVTLTGQLPTSVENLFNNNLNQSLSIIVLAPKAQWDGIINTLPNEYQSMTVVIDSDDVERTQRLALKALFSAFDLSPVGRAASTKMDAISMFKRHDMKNLWADVNQHLADDYPLYSQAKAALNACALPASNSASDFADYRTRCDTIVNGYINQARQHNQVITAIRQAITQGYLPWMQKNARGTRGLTRFWQWHHGGSGVRRANELLALVNGAACTPKELNQRLAQVWIDSSNTTYSLKSFLQTALGPETCQRFNLPVITDDNKTNKFSLLC